MLLLSAAANTVQEPDYIALAMVIAIAVIFAIYALNRMSKKKRVSAEPVERAVPVEETAPVLAPGSAGQLKLHDVEPKTAAMVMAIVADKLSKPLNELRFISIKEVK